MDLLKRVISLKYKGKLKTALSLAENSISEVKCKDELYFQIANIYNLKRSFARSIRYLKKAIDLNNKKVKAYLELGYAYYNQGKLDEAIEILDKVIQLDKLSIKPYALKGLIYIEKGFLVKAEEVLKKALDLLPYDSETLYYYGNLMIEKQDYKNAVKYYLDALKYDNLYDEDKIQGLKNNLGYVYFYLKEYDKSIEVFKDLTSNYPNHALYWNNLARLYIEKDDLQKAKKYLDKAKKLDKNLDLVYSNYGLIYLKEGNKVKAKMSFKKALSLNPYNEEALKYM